MEHPKLTGHVLNKLVKKQNSCELTYTIYWDIKPELRGQVDADKERAGAMGSVKQAVEHTAKLAEDSQKRKSHK